MGILDRFMQYLPPLPCCALQIKLESRRIEILDAPKLPDIFRGYAGCCSIRPAQVLFIFLKNTVDAVSSWAF
jgi:hypothetical protein